MILFFWMILDHSPIMRHMYGNRTNNVLNALIWPCYIIAPLVYMNMYCTCNDAIYMTMLGNIYLGMGAMWTTVFFAAIFIFLFSNPVETIMDLTLRRLVASTKVVWPQDQLKSAKGGSVKN
jgi:hypothetical protein